jgi:hypothetical protein
MLCKHMPSAGTISIISNINYLLSENFYHYFHKKKVFRVSEYRFWYSIIGRSSEYPVNRVLVDIIEIVPALGICLHNIYWSIKW